MDIITAIIGVCVTIVGLFGWSHRTLTMKIDKQNERIEKALPENQVRQIIEDKLAPIYIEYKSLSARLAELKASNTHLDRKIDQVLYNISKLKDD